MLVALDAAARDFARLVGGIVEHLNIQFVARIIELRDAIDQPLDHVAFVVDGKLYGNLGPLDGHRRHRRHAMAIAIIIVDQHVAVDSVGRQDHQHQKIRNHDGEIERVGLVEAAKRGVRQFAEIVRDRIAALQNRRDAEDPTHRFTASAC